jgi:hypothetical protein
MNFATEKMAKKRITALIDEAIYELIQKDIVKTYEQTGVLGTVSSKVNQIATHHYTSILPTPEENS